MVPERSRGGCQLTVDLKTGWTSCDALDKSLGIRVFAQYSS